MHVDVAVADCADSHEDIPETIEVRIEHAALSGSAAAAQVRVLADTHYHREEQPKQKENHERKCHWAHK